MLAATNRIGRGRVDEVLELVGLSEVGDQRAGKFSLGMGQRLGIAAALLGDPGVLLFDEPVNGLDPDGIRWVRNLLRGLAKEGRTVFVSSHLMSEMALTADEVVVIGRGRLIAQMPVSELTATSAGSRVTVRSPAAGELRAALEGAGASVMVEPDGALSVRDMSAPAIGDLAARCGLALHELAPHAASLEEAFMELTEDSIDYRGEQGFASATEGANR
jgi:ABC-2 type transport system ATP-binding protein